MKPKKELDLVTAVSPHMHSGWSIQKVMLDVLVALLPAAATAVYYFGTPAASVILVSVITCVVTEYVWQQSRRLPVRINDLSAAVTGLLFALTLPPATPLWITAIGAVIAILLGKQVFGGLGHNVLNPALAARAVLHLAWPVEMSTWTKPFEAVTSATPLVITKYGVTQPLPTYMDMLLGNHAGSLGETGVLALLAGGLYLILRRDIFLSVPITFIATVAVGAMVFNADPIFHVLAGGLMLGAFFMATDPVTSPVSLSGRILFGLGCGAITILIRMHGMFPEGVCYAILIMNLSVPLMNRYLIPKRFGDMSRI